MTFLTSSNLSRAHRRILLPICAVVLLFLSFISPLKALAIDTYNSTTGYSPLNLTPANYLQSEQTRIDSMKAASLKDWENGNLGILSNNWFAEFKPDGSYFYNGPQVPLIGPVNIPGVLGQGWLTSDQYYDEWVNFGAPQDINGFKKMRATVQETPLRLLQFQYDKQLILDKIDQTINQMTLAKQKYDARNALYALEQQNLDKAKKAYTDAVATPGTDPWKAVNDYKSGLQSTLNSPTSAAALEASRVAGRPSVGDENDGLLLCKDNSFSMAGLMACIGEIVVRMLATLAEILLHLIAWLVWAAGAFFNFSLYMTLHIKDVIIQTGGGVAAAWSAIRDLINILFIFVFLYGAINVIFTGDTKFIKPLLIAALLVNFSYFGTSLLIDASNIVANGIFTQIVGNAASTPASASAASVVAKGTDLPYDSGFSEFFMKKLCLQTVVNMSASGGSLATKDPLPTTKALSGSLINATNDIANWAFTKIIIATILGGMLMLTTAVIFLAGGIILLIRTVMLIFLLALSPAAFVGGILPQTKKYQDEWKKALSSNLLFAPIFMISLYVAFSILNKIQLFGTTAGDVCGGGFFALFTQSNVTSIAIIFNFLIVIGFLLAALAIAKSSGISGSEWAVKKSGELVGKVSAGTLGWIGRKTVGKAASQLANNENFKYMASKSKLVEMSLNKIKGVAGSSFDARAVTDARGVLGGKPQEGGYEQEKKDREKKLSEGVKDYEKNTANLANYFRRLSETDQKSAYKGLDAQRRAELDSELRKRTGDGLAEKLRGTLSDDDRRNTFAAILRQEGLRGKPDEIAKLIVEGIKDGKQQNMVYEQLNPTDRAKVDERLDKGPWTTAAPTSGGNWKEHLRRTLSKEEELKTKAAENKFAAQAKKEADAVTTAADNAKNAAIKARIDAELEGYATNVETVARHAMPPVAGMTNPVADAIAQLVKIDNKHIVRLNHASRMNDRVIQNLTPDQLMTLMEHGNTTDDEKRFISSVVTAPATHSYPNQAAHQAKKNGSFDYLWTP